MKARFLFFNKIIWLPVGISLVLGSVLWIGGVGGRDKVVVQVGTFEITQKDELLRDAVSHFFFPGETRRLGLQQLVEAYTKAQILINNGYALDEKKTEAEEERIDRTTAMPDKLRGLKAIFHFDRAAYRRVYVLPTLVERVIYYEFFLHDPSVQAASLQAAQLFLQEVRTQPHRFEILARQRNINPTVFWFSSAEGLQWNKRELAVKKVRKDEAHAPAAPGELGKWREEIISQLKPGQVFDKIVDFDEQWAVVRLVRNPTPKEARHELQGVFFPKISYADWLEIEQKKVNVTLFTKSQRK